jgi:hypothetical protein
MPRKFIEVNTALVRLRERVQFSPWASEEVMLGNPVGPYPSSDCGSTDAETAFTRIIGEAMWRRDQLRDAQAEALLEKHRKQHGTTMDREPDKRAGAVSKTAGALHKKGLRCKTSAIRRSSRHRRAS